MTASYRQSRKHRATRLLSAWLTLAASKGLTLLVQFIAIPTVYRSIGPVQFAAYAAVTSIVSILGFLNLGMGGALVTPLAHAATNREHQREANLLGATLLPILAVAAAILCVAVPFLLLLPTATLFGLVAKSTPPELLRTTAVLACIGTVGAIPLSVIDSARQAYQETHVSNLFGTLTNAILCVGLLLVARFAPTLPAFVAITALSPLVVRLLNAVLLFARRPYLRNMRCGRKAAPLVCRMATDGISYMGAAAIANFLVYQWPVYYVTRVRPPAESSAFAICLQLVVLALSFGVSLAQPLWPAIADACSHGDNKWVLKMVRRARTTALVYGIGALFAYGSAMDLLLRLWLHGSVQVTTTVSWLAGAYILLATWEYVHWPLALGLGALRTASHLVLARAIAVALFVPFAAAYGQVGLFLLLCTSIALITAWSYPRLMARRSSVQPLAVGSAQ